MKRSVPAWQMGGFIFTGILGTFLHFLFDLAGGCLWAGLFSAVNESIWEHMKLLFYPMALFALLEFLFWGKETPGFWKVKLMGILVGLVLIPVIYYTYTGILGVSADWFNIAIFFLASGAAYFLETRRFQRGLTSPAGNKLSAFAIVALALVFTVLTFFPPEIPLFRDPQDGTYGYHMPLKTGFRGVLCRRSPFSYFFRRSAMVMPSKNSSIIRSSFSHMGRVSQQVSRPQALGPWQVQPVDAREPSVSLRMLPTVYSSGDRFSR